jgi:broad specificity phosphatase PhoE
LRDEIAATDPARYATWRERPAEVIFEGGESLRDVLARWQRFRASFRTSVPALIVTHDAIVRVALLDIMGRPLDDFWNVRVENAGYAIVEVDGPAWTLVDESVTGHLADLRANAEKQAL